MQAKEKVPLMTEVIKRGEAETVIKARKVFRSSLVVGMESVLGYDNLSKLEAWFINKALESYRSSMGRQKFLENGLTILNAAAGLAGLELYEQSMLGVYEAVAGWRIRRAEATMRKLEREVEAAQKTIEEQPQKLAEIRRFNENLGKVVDRWVRPAVNGIGEGVGAIPAFGLIMLGVAGGAVGFATGRMARLTFELAKAKIKALFDRSGLGL
ncbi:MAG: hypothetical protein AAB973_01935 [Patescibacteria group bacterium]